jgi:hypothetical protein
MNHLTSYTPPTIDANFHLHRQRHVLHQFRLTLRLNASGMAFLSNRIGDLCQVGIISPVGHQNLICSKSKRLISSWLRPLKLFN